MMATTTYTPIESKTLGSAASSVTFSSIPSTYTDLILVVTAAGASADDLRYRFNSDSGTNYSTTILYGTGSAASSARTTNATSCLADYYGSVGTVLNSSIQTIHIMNYSNSTTYKTAIARGNRSDSGTDATVSLWRSTSAISSITLGIGNSYSVNFSVGSIFTLYGIANAAIGAPKATGGTITYDNTYYYHTFGASGTFTPQQSLTVDYLVIAGGGGGAVAHGGGGAGGLRSTVTATGGGGSLETPLSLTSGAAYTITVGAGGAGTSGASRGNGTNGVNSSIAGTGITTVTSVGGGGGGDADNAMSTGGSGGGAGYLLTSTGNNRTANQGYAGGGANPSTVTPNYPSGGGGGAGSVGQTVTSGSENGGDGGAGVSIPSIANATGTGVATYYAGGGAGGNYNNVTGGVATGGGGNAGTTSSINGTNGVVNTGGGGGATISTTTSTGNSGTSGTGGSGLVVIRYLKA
jgi:hypothetical protein